MLRGSPADPRRRGRSRLVGLMVVASVVPLVLAACSAGTAQWSFAPIPSASGPATRTPASPAPSGTPVAGSEVLGTIEIHAVDVAFHPNLITVAKAGRYEVKFTNGGSANHDVTFDDGTAIVAGPGETKTGAVEIPATGIGFHCSVPGHAEAGMTGTVQVGTTAAASPTAGASATPAGDGHGGAPGQIGDIPPDANAPPYTLYDATAPTPLSGTTHDIDLVVQEKDVTVAPGYVVHAWTFNGTVPGPVIRVHVGDTIRVHLKNPATSQLAHSIDFHASQVAWNDEMTSINPGEEKLYEWRADYAGVWMYHCGTAPALHHIANGMYGMVIVEPKAGLPKVDKEFALVQSEWYLAGQAQPASYTKAAAAAPAPDLVVFNGVAAQYKDHPLAVGTGEKVRVFLLDAGPNIDSSFHIVGTIFNTVIKEGIALIPGNSGGYGSQAVDLSPAQGAIIEFTTAEDGLYPVVTHAFNFVGLGAIGLVQAGDGDPKN
jgi:nitrite reductase (NO-forming)